MTKKWFPCCCTPQCYCLLLERVVAGVATRIYPGTTVTFTLSGGYNVTLTVTDIPEFICTTTGHEISIEVQITGGSPAVTQLLITETRAFGAGAFINPYAGGVVNRTGSLALPEDNRNGWINFLRNQFGLFVPLFQIQWAYSPCDEPE